MKWNQTFKSDSNICGDDSGQGPLLMLKGKKNWCDDDILERKKAFLDSKNKKLKKSKKTYNSAFCINSHNLFSWQNQVHYFIEFQ